MEEAAIDFLLVPLGLCLLVVYHLWLVLTIYRNPRRTVIGLNAESRRQWVFCVMTVSSLSFKNFFGGRELLFAIVGYEYYLYLIRQLCEN